MKLLSLKLLLGFLFFLFLFTQPSFAQETYFFDEEFNQERPPQTLDPDKWIVYPNRNLNPDYQGCLVNTISETTGILILRQCSTMNQFPYIVSKINPFPNGDFGASVRFQFPGGGGFPTGVKFVDTAPGNGGQNNELFGIGFEEVGNLISPHPFRIEYKNEVVFSKLEDSNYYIFKAIKQGNVYKLYLNDQLVFTSPETSEKVQALYIGNPEIIPSPGLGWTWPRVDYIRVVNNGPSEVTPQPFLDLPWDYGNQDFKEIIFDPNSWFDHKYPLQNFNCCIQSIIDYKGEQKDKAYKSHSGYDFGVRHEVVQGTPVLASAAGWATFVPESKSGGAGNMIKIDHENGYQTWYEHLDPAELVVNSEGERKHVEKGEKIGKVGLTGKTTGYHIHLSVFKDINGNGDFSDDYPFGLLDPLGWEGNYTDPWEEYSSGGRHGAKSYKLFTGLTPPKLQQIPSSGGTVTDQELTLNIPPNASNGLLNFKIENSAFEKASDLVKSLVPTLLLSATNNLGQIISNFNNPLGLIYDYSKADLSNVNEDSISFYFFNSSSNIWEKMTSNLDKTNKTVSSQTTHFSQFAVMAEALDITPPETTAQIVGDKGTGNWYRSDVTVNVVSLDNSGGKGVDYIVYSLDGENWNKYQSPIGFNTEGNHKIYFLAHDKVGNDESQKSIEFSIDKTPPKINITSPKDNDIYLLNQEGILADYSCSDPSGSGLQSCQGTTENGGNINTQSVGGKTFTVEALDNAGNPTTEKAVYTVQYNSSGLCNNEPAHAILQPINPDGTSIFKQGSTVPAKFRVCDAQGIPVSENPVQSFTLAQVSSASTTNINESVSSTTPDSNFRFDPLNKQWIFNMNTKNLLAGKTYFYRILLNDLTDIQFSFGLR